MQFKWLNESKVTITGDRIEMLASPRSDFFCSSESAGEEGITPESLCNAPYYYTEIKGDFVLKVKASHNFVSTYDAAVVMIMKDMNCWAKLCFEKTDFDTRAVVSVVTNGESDDANGCNIEGTAVWLQAVRMGNAFAFHYSLDGEHFYMTRYFHLPVGNTVKVGLVAQSPQGKGGIRIFENLTIEHKTVKNIRAGK